ncbi:7TM-DISM domain-containing protein [Rhodothermus marinus]|uniref:7TM-DISM domain-containing protein n=1 Tax=Rhodothermus marinus TaxID=29549 RepID=UPI001FB1D5A2|nr:7TM-DISM domain-containing protein [Rhodothermus marinus]
MALYNLFLFLVVRERSYLYYVMLTALLALFWLSASGYLADLFWSSERAIPTRSTFTCCWGPGSVTCASRSPFWKRRAMRQSTIGCCTC